MSVVYAMSDIHGEMEAFQEALENIDLANANARLIFLGDLIDHAFAKPEIYFHVMNLQKQFPGQVIALMGNIDRLYMEQLSTQTTSGASAKDRDLLLKWLKSLNSYYETEAQIFVHAGIDEEAQDLWRVGTDRYTMEEKYPPSTGRFLKDIVAGHVGTSDPHLAGDYDFQGIFWDGESHFYIDGSSEITHFVPVLKYDTESCRYTTFRPRSTCGEDRQAEIPLAPFHAKGSTSPTRHPKGNA